MEKIDGATQISELLLLNNLTRGNSLYAAFIRMFDLIFSLIGLILFSPIIIFSAICIVLETPGSPIYTQYRVGILGKEFKIYKLRSMYTNAELNGAQLARKNDFRITRVGNFIRKTRIDELPQFLNVLKGDMSLIGPRPERAEFIKQIVKDTPEFVKRLQIKPGITGLAQVRGGYDLSPKEKLKLDLYYIENRSIILDIKIVFETIGVVISGNGSR